jgi:thiol-disulfide isomerase/thioredoxin
MDFNPRKLIDYPRLPSRHHAWVARIREENNMRILRFSAIWCMNCIFMKSAWEEIEDEFSDLAYEEYDADDQADIHKRFNIKDVPTVIFIDDSGREIVRLEGAKDKEELVAEIKKHI